MALVDDQHGVVRQVIVQGRRRLAGTAAGEVAGVVLDAGAVADLQHHLQVEDGALLQALGLHQLVVLPQQVEAVLELHLDLLDGAEDGLPRGRVVGLGKDGVARDLAQHLAGEGIEQGEGLDLVVEQLDSYRLVVRLRGIDVDHIAAHPVASPVQLHLVALVLQRGQPPQDGPLVDQVAAGQVQDHA